MTLEDKNKHKKIKVMFLAGVMTAAIVLGVTALVLRKPSSTVQPPTAPSSLPASEQPASEHDNDHDKDDRDDDDEDD